MTECNEALNVTQSATAKKTAQWWTSQLRSSSVKMDNGVPGHAALHGILTAMLPVKDDKYSDEQLKLFEANLTQRIDSDIAEKWSVFCRC